MIVLRGTPEQLARIHRLPQRGLLAWLYEDGVLLIPQELVPAMPGPDDDFLRDLEHAMRQPVEPLEHDLALATGRALADLEPFPVRVEPHRPPRWSWRRPRWWPYRG